MWVFSYKEPEYWTNLESSADPPHLVWTPDPTREEGSGKNLARKCLERWNAAVSVDEGTNITSANQRSS